MRTTGTPEDVGSIHLRRVYDAPTLRDGVRILVDRIWPRGISKQTAAVDVWLKEIAPSSGLRTWFAHDPAKWDEFRARFRRELEQNASVVGELQRLIRGKQATLVYAARDEEHNNAVALREYLMSK